MNKEVKEILDRLNNIPMGELYACCLEDSECKIILEYITNLQYKYEIQLHRYMNLKEQTINLQQENEKLKERCDYLQRSCDRKEEQRDDARMEYMEQEDYKSRCEKAIEYIIENSEMYDEDLCTGVEFELRDLLNILNGGDE